MRDDPELPGIPETPELLKWVRYGWHHVRQEGDMVKKAPLALLIAAITGLVIGYFIASARFSDRAEIADKRAEFANEEVKAYQEKLKGASPDEAAKKIADLENRLQPVLAQLGAPQRHLTDDQKNKIIAASKQYVAQLGTGYFILIWSSQDRDSETYSAELFETFKNAGLHAVWGGGGPAYPLAKDEHDIMIQMPDPEHPSDATKAVMDILAKSGLQYTTEADPNDYPNPPDADVFVTTPRAKSVAK